MSSLAERLRNQFYRPDAHPYRVFERTVGLHLQHDACTLLDAGCGRTVPVLRTYLGRARRLIGVELVEFTDVPDGIETHNADLAHIPVQDGSVDVIMSRSVFEHLTNPDSVYAELARVLKPGGRIIFLTANLYDYGTMVARMVPNRFHGKVVKAVEGRPEEDTFPTAYKTNKRSDIERLSAKAGLEVKEIQYLSQYPNYLLFNGFVFFLGMCLEKVIARYDALRLLRGWIMVTLEKPRLPA